MRSLCARCWCNGYRGAIAGGGIGVDDIVLTGVLFDASGGVFIVGRIAQPLRIEDP